MSITHEGEGIIKNIRESDTRFGKKYSMLIDSASGDRWLDFFTQYPLKAGVSVGAHISFTWDDPVGTFNPKMKNLKVLAAGSGAPVAVAPSTTPGAPPAAGPTQKDLFIMRQNAVTNANTMMQHNSNARLYNKETPEVGYDGSYNVKELLEVAEILVSYYTGELDVAAIVALAQHDTA